METWRVSNRPANFYAVKPYTQLTQERLLHLNGEVLVSQGEAVGVMTILARSLLPQETTLLRVAKSLSLGDEAIPRFLVKKIGDRVSQGEILVQTSSGGPGARTYRSPSSGILVSQVQGRLVLADSLTPQTLLAHILGQVIEVIPQQGVVLETKGAVIEGSWGNGGEAFGRLEVGPSEGGPLPAQQISNRSRGAILVGEGWVEKEALLSAQNLGVQGLILGSFPVSLLPVASELAIPIMVTEGFGKLAMVKPVAELLRKLSGKEGYLNAGGLRPGLIIPLEPMSEETASTATLKEGSLVRIAAGPKRGGTGLVTDPSPQWQRLESGISAGVVEVLLEGGDRIPVPVANLELLG